MHVGEISFCNKIGSNVKSDEFKQHILEQLATFKCRVIQKHHERFVLPGSIDILNANPHMMTMRTNGNPYYLFLTTYNGINQCIFIDKKVQHGYVYPRMVIVKFWMDDALFNNTLFSGEMVGENSWTFLIHDIHADSGMDMSSTNLVRRLSRCYEVLQQLWVSDPRQDVCEIRVKRYFQYQEYNEMIEWSKQLPYSCRGIYFKPLFLKFKDILFNFDEGLVRKVEKVSTYNNKQFVTKEEQAEIVQEVEKKESTSTTKIMSIQKTAQPDIYQVFDGSTDVGVAFVNNIRVSKMLRMRFENATPIDKIKFTSVFNARFQKWEPVEEVQIKA